MAGRRAVVRLPGELRGGFTSGHSHAFDNKGLSAQVHEYILSGWLAQAGRRKPHRGPTFTEPLWRSGWDSNPRYGCPYGRFSIGWLRPLTHHYLKCITGWAVLPGLPFRA
jgi:hypothetical protein